MSWCCAGGCTCGDKEPPEAHIGRVIVGLAMWSIVLVLTAQWGCSLVSR